ncbi:MAG: hypothetical protein IIB74_06770 [Proteobacteria bacterium]|nr:hypothetical protein [Pseudomonadota bacterium]
MAQRHPMLTAYKRVAASAALLLLAVAWPTAQASTQYEVAADLADETAAAIREAFEVTQSAAENSPDEESAQTVATSPMAKTKSPADATDINESQTEAPLGMNTRLPGVSEKDLLLFKKQMYRKDI